MIGLLLGLSAAACASDVRLAVPTLNRATPSGSPAPRLALVITITPRPSPSPTKLSTPTLTPIPPTPTPLPWSLLLPKVEDAYPVFPWQIVITSTAPLTLSLWLEPLNPATQPYTITLAGRQVSFSSRLALISNQKTTPESQKQLYRWTRQVNDLRELKDGIYRLLLDTTRGKSEARLVLDSAKAISARVLDRDGSVGIRFLPTERSERNGKNVLDKEPVRILGQLIYLDEQGQVPIYNSYEMPEQWCFFQTQDARRGWVWCKVFVPYEEVDHAPLLALPISDRLYTRGGQ
jgi:hypothetical protein